MQAYYAHTDEDGCLEHGQLLVDHLKAVADSAAGFAAPVGASGWARVAGLLHDAGKASDAFQRRLAGAPIKVDHATAGAQLARETMNKSPERPRRGRDGRARSGCLSADDPINGNLPAVMI